MKRQPMWLVLLVLLTPGTVERTDAAQRGAPRREQAAEVRLTGEVTGIHAARVFTVRERDGREVMVLAPRPLQPGFVGATVTVEGSLRRLTDAEVRRDIAIGELTGQTRDRLVRGPVLVAHSVMAMSRTEAAPAVEEAPAPAPAPAEPVQPLLMRRGPREEQPIVLRASMLVANLDVFAGRQVRLINGHVVGVLEPGAFLIEPATPYMKPLGQRDRVLILIGPSGLRVPDDLFVGATVTVTGVARTLLGMQVTREAAWPARLRPEAAERLEVRAVILARSVQTLDGTELTDRPAGTAGR